MFSHADDLYARAKYEDMLREAEQHRRFAHVTGESNFFERAFAALRSAFTAQRAPVQKPGASAAKRLAAE